MSIRTITTLRSLLFAPAMRTEVVASLGRRGADAVVIDCEDATPAALKVESRAVANEHARQLAAEGVTVTVRINAPTTEWFRDDVATLWAGLAAVVVPKVERVEELDVLTDVLDSIGLTDLGVIAGIETALGVADARALLCHPRVVGGYFGAEDFIADMGGRRTPGNEEVAFARAQVALAGRLAGVAVLDQIVADFRDDARFERECQQAAALGFAGKLCIHPAQVALANAGFQPTQADIERARRLLDAYEAGLAAGRGAISFEGQMVDEPLAAQARRVLSFERAD